MSELTGAVMLAQFSKLDNLLSAMEKSNEIADQIKDIHNKGKTCQ